MKSRFPPIVLKKENAIRVELSKTESKWRSTPYKIWIFICAAEGCPNELRVWGGKLKLYTGYCTSCHSKKLPYGVVYNRLLSNCKLKKIKNTITYDQLVEFTKISNCTYCSSTIKWIEF